jgi:hypothetical protein
MDALKGKPQHFADVAKRHLVGDQFFHECFGLRCCVLLLPVRIPAHSVRMSSRPRATSRR